MPKNLSFIARWDSDKFKAKCRDQRRIAERWPAYDKRMGTVEEYACQLGPWHLVFLLEVWDEPAMWHGSAAILEQIGTQSVKFEQNNWGFKAGTIAEIPQDALLSIQSWVPEHFEQARFILAEVFGPILRPGDDHQQAEETTGLWALHWRVKYEGEKTWIKNQN